MEISSPEAELDVVIVGAGITGIAAAAQLKQNCPDKTFAVLEMRSDIGGTWDLFKYPGVRSDSDMFTLGYGFKPWTDPQAIASAESIKNYLHETVNQLELVDYIRLGNRLAAASWDSGTNRWTLSVERADGPMTLRCHFLYLASGYYSYRSGYNPQIPGESDFEGRMIHPQHWPADLEYQGKKIAIIGSGATAITLVPNLAKDAGHVTMVQRSPGYIHIESGVDEGIVQLREELGPEEAFRQVRLRNRNEQQRTFREARTDPESFKKMLFDPIDEIVGEDIRKRHFTPTYEPWDQRVCVAPDGDLFYAIRDGRASVVTGHIDRITPNGIAMQSGETVDADIIVKATGLVMEMGGEVKFSVDGQTIDIGQCWTYRGLAYSGVPNLVYGFGYYNASWTLRIEIVNEFWCRLLRHMDEVGAARVTPTISGDDEAMTPQHYLAGVTSGYVRRGTDALPRQGSREPWVNPQNYEATVRLLETVDDGVLRFES